MPKPTKYATPICLMLTVLALLGMAIGTFTLSPIVIILFLIPVVIYEVYRTEGESTRWSSWLLLIVLFAEIFLIYFKINFDLASFFDTETKYIGGYVVPLGDIQTFAPALMAVLSIILFFRTRGIYTKWLAVIIFVASLAIIRLLSPEIFMDLIKSGVDQMPL